MQTRASRRAIGLASLAGALGPLVVVCAAAAPAPARAAIVDDDIAMRVFEEASPSVVSIVNYASKVCGVMPRDGCMHIL